MKRVPLYSRSQRPTETPVDAGSGCADAGAAPRRPGRSRWAAPSRHERRLWAVLIVCVLAVAFWWSNPTCSAKPPLTIEQIDAAIRQSIEDKPLVSPSRAPTTRSSRRWCASSA